MKQSSFSIPEIVFLIFAFCLTIWIVAPPGIGINNANIDSQKVIDQTDFKHSVISTVKDKISKVDDLVINTINTTSSQEPVITPKKGNNSLDYNTLLALLSLTTLLSISISFWLYRWRKIAISGNEIVVPETFSQQVNDIVLAVKNSSSKLGSVVNQQSNAVGQSSNSLALLSENIKEMIEVHMKLQSTLDQKEDEINRYKEGYDAKIFHNFLLRFVKVDISLKQYIEDNEDNEGNEEVKDILELMEYALYECDVKAFSPELGSNYKTAEGVADNPKKIDTNDESKHFAISDVFDEGYRREMDDGSYKIITQAKVSVYIYKKPEQEIDGKEQNDTIQE